MPLVRFSLAVCGLLLLASCTSSEAPVAQPAEEKPPPPEAVSGPKATDPAPAEPAPTKPTTPPAAAALPTQGPGVAVGQKAPPLALKDQDGRERTLKNLLAHAKVALVFYRSADW